MIFDNEVMKRNYFYWLDTFRFFAAFFVVLTHARFWFFQPYGLLEEESKNIFTQVLFSLTSLGGDAVVMFFILSGFLVGGRTIEKLCNGEFISPSSFALSRFVRIIIPLAAVLCINSVFNTIQGLPNDLWRIVGNLLCLQGAFVEPEPGIGVLWTMSYIVWFYMLILSFMLIAQKQSSVALGGICTLFLTLWVFLHTGEGLFNVVIVACGVLSYFLAKKKLCKGIYLISIVVAIFATALCHLSGESISFRSLPVDRLFFKALQVVSYSVVIGLSVRYVPQSRWAVRFEVLMSKLSKISYSLYLIHLPVIMMMVYLGVQRLPYVSFWSLLLFLGGISVCILCAWLIYVLVERPANRLKERFQQ